MKMIVVALALVAVAVAAPTKEDADAQIVRSNFNQDPDGKYEFGSETSNGITRNEKGELKQVLDEDKKPHDVLVVRGSFSYVRPDGTTETIEYEADENGFRAFGPSIPVAPAASARR